MPTRRGFFAQFGSAVLLSEAAYAQRAAVKGSNLPSDMVWLNANENPAGPPQCSLDAIRGVPAEAGRYHYNEFGAIETAIAGSEGLTPEQITLGCGSSEVLHIAVNVYTSPTRP